MRDGLSIILEQVNNREVELEERRQELADLVIDITEAERDKVRTKASKGIRGFWFFAKKVFPEYFKYPFGSLHKDIIKFSSETKRRVHVVAGPPEHGKTTLLRIWKIWASIYGKRHYIIKVCETNDLSLMDMKSIKLEFEMNPRINFLYGDLRTRGSWEDSRFVIAPTEWNKAGTLFEAFAYGIPPTGRIWKHYRPDFCDIDDLENYKRSANIKISKEKLQFINNDIIPRMAEDAPIIWFGNNARRTMAMNIIIEMNKDDRQFEYPAFEIHVYPAWNVKWNRPLWKERFGKYKTQEEMRVGLGIGMMTWLGNFMQNPVTPEGGIFKRVHWQEYRKIPNDAIGIMRCDPASGKTKSACYKVAVVMLYSRSTRKFYVVDAYVRQSDWEPYFQAMYNLYERFQDKILRIDWESNFYQDQYLKFRELYPSVSDKPELPINPIEIKSNKDIDIQTFAVPYEFGQIFYSPDFGTTADGQEGKAQQLGYPDHPYNDFPDAAARAYKTLFNMFAGYIKDETSGGRGYESLEQSRFSGFK